MHALGVIFIDVLIAFFFIGMAGSAVVVVISFVEDFHELFDKDDSAPEPARPPQSTAQTPASASFNSPKASAKEA
jgi:hypothetical protein